MDLESAVASRIRMSWPAASDGLARVHLQGDLDAVAAAELHRAYEQAAAAGSRRLEIDLSGIIGATRVGVDELARCLRLGRQLPEGIGVTVANEVGRRALLASMTGV